MTTRTIALWAPKGGQGTSTTAALMAVSLTGRGQVVQLTAATPEGMDDLQDIMGVSAFGADRNTGTYVGGLYLAPPHVVLSEMPDTVRVVDCGTDPNPAALEGVAVDRKLMVVRNCFIALRRAVQLVDKSTDGVIVVTESSRALGPADVRAVLPVPVVASLLVSTTITRAVDAGCLDIRTTSAQAKALADAARLVAA